MNAPKQSLAATLLLAGVLLQLLGAAVPAAAMWCVIGFYASAAVAAVLMKTPLALVAAGCGAVVGVLQTMGQIPIAWLGAVGINLVYLALYLPLQAAFGRALYDAQASQRTLALGRRWSITLLLARGFSMMGVLPYFAGQDAISKAQGAPTLLLQLQLSFEVIAVVVIMASYYFMVRYLWYARALLNTGRKL